ncbi:uncharacterized protein LOC113360240 [Papaver somniferum]|uniref:uncharacterized protein LOC113360240 n=1 Tax=Papaver somniferum TaxID=3469 RepID=UPI000E7055C4|nr:uncharacterized protein LOC113360240 [Papaver somniferum]
MIQFSDTDRCANWTSGFGYISSTNEYKVVGIRVSPLQTKIIEVYVYTLGSGNGWRNLGTFNIDFGLTYMKQGIFANGALYWINTDLEMIFTFDLTKEKFREHLSPPPLPPNGNWCHNKVGVLDGFLYFAVWLSIGGDEGYSCFDIWLLEKKNDMKGPEEHQSFGWTKKFRLEDDQLIAVTKSGKILNHTGNYLNIYDPKVAASKRLVDFEEWIREIYPHKSTLISLKQLGEEDTEIMESIEFEKTESCGFPSQQPEEVEALDTLVSLKESILEKKIPR